MPLVHYGFPQSISPIRVKKVGYWDNSGVLKKIAEVAQKKEHDGPWNNWSMMSFIQSKSEIYNMNLQGLQW